MTIFHPPFPLLFLLDIFDKNSSGTIDINEFQQLFDYINQWKAVFQSFDKDRSGKIELAELTQGNLEKMVWGKKRNGRVLYDFKVT